VEAVKLEGDGNGSTSMEVEGVKEETGDAVMASVDVNDTAGAASPRTVTLSPVPPAPPSPAPPPPLSEVERASADITRCDSRLTDLSLQLKAYQSEKHLLFEALKAVLNAEKKQQSEEEERKEAEVKKAEEEEEKTGGDGGGSQGGKYLLIKEGTGHRAGGGSSSMLLSSPRRGGGGGMAVSLRRGPLSLLIWRGGEE